MNSSNFNVTILKFSEKFDHPFSHFIYLETCFLRVTVSLQWRLQAEKKVHVPIYPYLITEGRRNCWTLWPAQQRNRDSQENFSGNTLTTKKTSKNVWRDVDIFKLTASAQFIKWEVYGVDNLSQSESKSESEIYGRGNVDYAGKIIDYSWWRLELKMKRKNWELTIIDYPKIFIYFKMQLQTTMAIIGIYKCTLHGHENHRNFNRFRW